MRNFFCDDSRPCTSPLLDATGTTHGQYPPRVGRHVFVSAASSRVTASTDVNLFVLGKCPPQEYLLDLWRYQATAPPLIDSVFPESYLKAVGMCGAMQVWRGMPAAEVDLLEDACEAFDECATKCGKYQVRNAPWATGFLALLRCQPRLGGAANALRNLATPPRGTPVVCASGGKVCPMTCFCGLDPNASFVPPARADLRTSLCTYSE